MTKKVVKLPQGTKPAAQPQVMTEEQRIAAISRGFTQAFQNIAQGALFNLLNNASSFGTAIAEPGTIVDAALKIASDYMEKVGKANDACFDKVMNKPADAEKAAE